MPVKSCTQQLQKLINIYNQTQHTVKHYRAIWNQYWALTLLQVIVFRECDAIQSSREAVPPEH